MERRTELKARARELEYGDRPEEALAAYLQLLDRSDHPSPALWARAGEMQVRLGQLEDARGSLTRAIEGFSEGGQPNNALAVGRMLAEAGLDTPDLQLRLGRLALDQGYRPFAREAIAAYARAVAEQGRSGDAVDPIAAFLGRFPDEGELWRDWADELLALGREDEAVAGLRALAAAIGGQGVAAAAIDAELRRLRPRPGAPDEETAPVEIAASLDEEDDKDVLPLLDTPAAEDQDARAVDVAPLEGLETTHAQWEPPPAVEGSGDSLPLLDLSPEPEAAPVERAPDEEVETDHVEPLPLLDHAGQPPDAPANAGEPWDASADALGPAGAPVDAVADALSNAQFDTGERADTPAAVGESRDAAAVDGEPFDAPTPLGEPSDAPADAAASGLDIRVAVAELLRVGVSQVDRAEDASTHYDLGVAFKGMGLLDESIGHLASALEGGHDPIATLEVLGEVLVSAGRYDIASRLLGAVVSGDSPAPELLGVRYWIGRSAEELGEHATARLHYQRVLDADPGFRDAADRLRRIGSGF